MQVEANVYTRRGREADIAKSRQSRGLHRREFLPLHINLTVSFKEEADISPSLRVSKGAIQRRLKLGKSKHVGKLTLCTLGYRFRLYGI